MKWHIELIDENVLTEYVSFEPDFKNDDQRYFIGRGRLESLGTEKWCEFIYLTVL